MAGSDGGTPTVEGVRRAFASNHDLATARDIQQLLQEWAAASSAKEASAAAQVAGAPAGGPQGAQRTALTQGNSGLNPRSPAQTWAARSRRRSSRPRGPSLPRSTSCASASCSRRRARHGQRWRPPWSASEARSCPGRARQASGPSAEATLLPRPGGVPAGHARPGAAAEALEQAAGRPVRRRRATLQVRRAATADRVGQRSAVGAAPSWAVAQAPAQPVRAHLPHHLGQGGRGLRRRRGVRPSQPQAAALQPGQALPNPI